jgi:hypothetical protein
MENFNNVIYQIRQRQNHTRIEEFRARKRFRLWKIGKQFTEPKDAFYNITVHVASLIFENAKPTPVSLNIEWINDEAYYAEGWILNISWKDTPYQEYRDLLAQISRNEAQYLRDRAWKKLQQIADIITDYELASDPKQRDFHIQTAMLYMHEYSKRLLIIKNIGGIALFLADLERLPKPEEVCLQ